MTPIGRMYQTEAQARDAVNKLVEGGFAEETIVLLSPDAAGVGDSALEMARSVLPAEVPGHHAIVYARGLERGQSLVLVDAPFGWGEIARNILVDCGPVSAGPPRLPARRPAPFSDLIGFPTLSTRGRSYFSRVLPELTGPGYSFSSKVGLPLLSRNPAPLSSLLRLKTVSSKKRR